MNGPETTREWCVTYWVPDSGCRSQVHDLETGQPDGTEESARAFLAELQTGGFHQDLRLESRTVTAWETSE